ncbi:hypothetical protein HZH68_013303 [Vespula germanica]|uniref:Uncharacterized protein n=1 Tax=Vespula germanica TaxID=30212 RepID=A0A834JEH0_VESGE|nr:hypothetical protein HZH68_013303 [Vespula germanica]
MWGILKGNESYNYILWHNGLLLPTLLFRKERILLLESLFLLKDISPGESLQAVSILVPSTESLNRVIQLKGTEKSCGSGEENERPTRDKNRKEQKGNGPITRMSSVVSKSNDKSVLLAVEGDLSPGTKDEAKAD